MRKQTDPRRLWKSQFLSISPTSRLSFTWKPFSKYVPSHRRKKGPAPLILDFIKFHQKHQSERRICVKKSTFKSAECTKRANPLLLSAIVIRSCGRTYSIMNNNEKKEHFSFRRIHYVALILYLHSQLVQMTERWLHMSHCKN